MSSDQLVVVKAEDLLRMIDDLGVDPDMALAVIGARPLEPALSRAQALAKEDYHVSFDEACEDDAITNREVLRGLASS